MLHVVLKFIPESISTDEIKEDLIAKGHKIEEVTRVRNRRTKNPLPLVLISAQKDQKQIYQLTDVVGLKITTEAQRPKTQISQCHPCQKFGHYQSLCKASPKCVKCAGEHFTNDCGKSPTTPPNCANCGENHHASYRECKEWPMLPRMRNPATPVTSHQTYATAASKNQPLNETEQNSLQSFLPTLMKQIMQMQTQLIELTRHMGTTSGNKEPSNTK